MKKLPSLLAKSWHFTLKALLREKMRWPHDKAAFPVGNQALFGIKLGFNSALAMYLDTNEYRISCVSRSYWIWKERTARQQISDTCLVPSRSRSLIWGIYELIIKEHGAKRVTVRGPSLLARTRRLFPSSLTRASHSSPVPRFKTKPLELSKTWGGGSSDTKAANDIAGNLTWPYLSPRQKEKKEKH